jgi:lipoprotein-releasing system permease protein
LAQHKPDHPKSRLNLKLSFFIAGRIAFNRERTFSRFIIRIAMTATALSVAVMILATALVNGFQHTVSQKVFGFWGDIHITRYQPYSGLLTEEVPFEGSDSLRTAISRIPGVVSVDAYATKSAILKAKDQIEGVVFKGVDRGYHWASLKPYLVRGGFIDYPDSGYSSQIVLSDYLARELKVATGDQVIVFFIQKGDASPRARKLTVTGIYKTSIEDYDKTYVIGDLNLLRRLNDWGPSEIGGFQVSLSDYQEMDSVRDRLYDQGLPQNLSANTIRQIYPNIFDWLNLQNMNEVIIIAIMTVVAIINMITAMLILILERTNMVGILKSLGMANGSLQRIFVYQAAYIVGAGLLIGNIFGLVVGWIQRATGLIRLNEAIYYMPTVPIEFKWWQIVAIDLGTLAVCVGVLIIPSLVIRRISPVRAVNFR